MQAARIKSKSNKVRGIHFSPPNERKKKIILKYKVGGAYILLALHQGVRDFFKENLPEGAAGKKNEGERGKKKKGKEKQEKT